MATEAVNRGPTGETVRANLKRLREKRGLSLRAMAKATEATNHPLGHGSINQIEQGRRRVDVDDLMTLAFVLSVPPNALLAPHVTRDNRNTTVETTGIGPINAGALWGWLKCRFEPVEVDSVRPLDELGVDPDYQVAQGTWIMSVSEREADDRHRELEAMRTQAMFGVIDLYWQEYVEYRENERD